MKPSKSLCLLVVCLLAVSCGDSDSSEAPRPVLELEFTEPPVDLEDVSARYAESVRYGEGSRNFLDIYLPDCTEPTGLAIYVHGGGFTGGSRSAGHNNVGNIREFLRNCVAYATVDYFLLDVPSREEGTSSIPAQGGVLSSLEDAALALQFLRYHYQSLNLDRPRVVMLGASAGAGASLWMATHDEMADPDNPDPVRRESTRIRAAGAMATQATYDVIRWDSILLPLTEQFIDVLGGTDVPTVAKGVGAENYMLTFLGVATVEEIFSEANEAYRANIDMLGMMDADDAPLFVRNYETGFGNLLNMFLHHKLHALAVKERADEVGLENVTYAEGGGAYGFQDPSGKDLIPFLLEHLE